MLFRQASSLRRLCVAAALLVGSVGAAQARVGVSVDLNFGYPYYGAVGYGYGYGHGYYGYRGPWLRPWGPAVVFAAPPVVYAMPADPPVVVERPAVSVAPTRPDPIIYPRNGQTSQQTEYDRQECNRWATTQPAAMAEASVFQRAVEACMDGRGYSMK